MILLLSFISFISVIFNIVFVYKCLILQDKLEEVSTDLEESLDIIDSSYSRISKLLKQSYVTDDDPFIKLILEEIKTAHDALLVVANKVVQFQDENEE